MALIGHVKAKLFVNGRKQIFDQIAHQLSHSTKKKIWFHVSSLGEFEQARPLIESITSQYPTYEIVLTFFSPSGYEIRKNYPHAKHIFYLPLDTKNNAERFINCVQPSLVFFTKYDFWYHYLRTLQTKQIPTLLFSAIFQPRQAFFKWYGTLHRQMLHCFRHLFVQDKQSLILLSKLQIDNVSVVGDSRIDTVLQNATALRYDPMIEQFRGNKKLIIGGSVWRSDWKLLLAAYSQIQEEYQLLLAPHDVSSSHIQSIIKDLDNLPYSLYSKDSDKASSQILILDTIGMLAHIYHYADIVWIGGGFKKSGIHNVLEPAVYGKPIFIGPNFQKFNEAIQLVNEGGIFSISHAEQLIEKVKAVPILESMRSINQAYIKQNSGAVKTIMDYLKLEKCLDATP